MKLAEKLKTGQSCATYATPNLFLASIKAPNNRGQGLHCILLRAQFFIERGLDLDDDKPSRYIRVLLRRTSRRDES